MSLEYENLRFSFFYCISVCLKENKHYRNVVLVLNYAGLVRYFSWGNLTQTKPKNGLMSWIQPSVWPGLLVFGAGRSGKARKHEKYITRDQKHEIN